MAWAGEAATGGKVHSDDESMYRLTATRTPSGLTERSELDESERDERYDGNWVRGERTSIQAKPGTKDATRDGPRVGPYHGVRVRVVSSVEPQVSPPGPNSRDGRGRHARIERASRLAWARRDGRRFGVLRVRSASRRVRGPPGRWRSRARSAALALPASTDAAVVGREPAARRLRASVAAGGARSRSLVVKIRCRWPICRCRVTGRWHTAQSLAESRAIIE